MSVKQALRFYQGLSRDQQRFINEKQINTTLQLREWIAFLKNTATYDEIGDNARKKNVTKIVFSVIGIIGSIFVTIWIPLLGIILIVIAVLVMAEAIRVNSKLVRLDLSNHLRLFLMPLLFVLREKSGEKANVTLSLDLRNPTKIEPTRKYKEFENDIKQFEPKYIIGKLQLLDETSMEFILSDDIRSIRLVKRSGGKTKIKHKNKVSRYYFIRLIFPKKYYAIRQATGSLAKIEESPDTITCKLNVKSKTSQIEEVASVEEFLKSVQELYSLVELRPGVKLPANINLAVPGPLPLQDAPPEATMMDNSAAMIPFLVWGGSYFGTRDYNGFTSESGFYTDDSTKDSFLDS
jgi:hypothetical protein